MAARQLALPDTFTGEDRQAFSDWIDHFESIAKVNKWDDDEKENWISSKTNWQGCNSVEEASSCRYRHL